MAGTSVVTGMQLQRESAGQVGEILASLPGVDATVLLPVRHARSCAVSAGTGCAC